MKYAIRTSWSGMPSDMDEARIRTKTYGPFSSEEAASRALRSKGWYQPEKNKWCRLSSSPGDRLIASIIELPHIELKSTKSFV